MNTGHVILWTNAELKPFSKQHSIIFIELSYNHLVVNSGLNMILNAGSIILAYVKSVKITLLKFGLSFFKKGKI